MKDRYPDTKVRSEIPNQPETVTELSDLRDGIVAMKNRKNLEKLAFSEFCYPYHGKTPIRHIF